MSSTAGTRTRLGVLGWPVAHSRSPAMQNAALQAVGLSEWRYQLLPVPPELLADTVRGLPGSGFRGANVTIPHKEAALALADSAGQGARAIGAANTLTFDAEGRIHAENTDAPGLIASLPFDVAGATALVLGAGGTGRAAVWALLDAGAREVRVWNRTAARARALTGVLGGVSTETAEPADVLVHCTSSGLDTSLDVFKQLPISVEDLSRYRCVVDFVYSASGTALVRQARERGVDVVDGIELLVAQGALAFELFTGRPAPRQRMREAVRWT